MPRPHLGIQQKHIGLHAIGDPRLGAVENVLVPLRRVDGRAECWQRTFLTTVDAMPSTSVPAPGSDMPMAPTMSPLSVAAR